MAPGTAQEGRHSGAWSLRRAAPSTGPLRLADLDPLRQRRAVLRCAATVVLAWVLIVGAFYVVPIGHESSARAFLRLGVDIALVAAVFAWQIRRIGRAELPELRAIEALGIVIVVFLVAFSSIYLAMSHEAATTFTQSLDQTRALYFTISVFSTVGFGDITPRTDQARLVVSAQMLLDFVIIGVAVRMLFNAARSRIDPAAAAPALPASPAGPAAPAPPAPPPAPATSQPGAPPAPPTATEEP
jgi:voltage-gated potassium channel